MQASGWRYRLYQRVKLRVAPLLRNRILSVEIHHPYLGFFAHLDWCTMVVEYCDRRGLHPQLSCTSPQYGDPARSPNWLSYFFSLPDPIPLVDFRIAHWSEVGIPSRYLNGRAIQRTSELVSRYMPLRPEIQMKLHTFCKRHFQGGNVLGIHFRGTDKIEEAPRVSWDFLRETVENYLRANPNIYRLFVASDEPPFFDFVRGSFSRLPVSSLENRVAGSYRTHLGSGNYQKGEDALLDCLLLSRCNAVIRCTSFLSAWASIFNPQLPIILLNRPYDDKLWYPESALIPKSMDQYLPQPGNQRASALSFEEPAGR